MTCERCQSPCPLPPWCKLPPMVVVRLLLLCLVLVPFSFLHAQAMQNQAAFDEGDEETYLAPIQKEAAALRLERSRTEPDAEADTAAAASLVEAQAAYDAKTWRAAANIAHRAFKRHRYTASSQVLGDLKRVQILANIERERILDVRKDLARVWLFFPDYARVGEIMETALELAERTQAFTTLVDLDAEEPGDVIRIEGTGFAAEVTKLFRFLSESGDRVRIGARADLGLARAQLLGGNAKDLSPARFAYNDFIQRHPRHPLVFDALCELALSHLITYRGDLYDVGALVNAALIIEQAELVAGADPERAALIAKYRLRIRGWHQDRDLAVARWYRSRQHPVWLAWLKDPSNYNWDTPARFYYQEVLRRDSGTPQARAAERELAELPPAERDPFRADLLPDRP